MWGAGGKLTLRRRQLEAELTAPQAERGTPVEKLCQPQSCRDIRAQPHLRPAASRFGSDARRSLAQPTGVGCSHGGGGAQPRLQSPGHLWSLPSVFLVGWRLCGAGVGAVVCAAGTWAWAQLHLF